MELLTYLTMQWTDPRLKFTYSQPFHDISQVRLNVGDIWMPDIELCNV